LTAFVVRPDRPLVQVLLGPVQPVADALDRWRTAVQRKSPVTKPDGAGAELRRLVWQPLEKELQGAQTVLVAPDGVLTRLPFAALPGRKPGTYLIEDVAVAVVPVPQLLPALLAPADKDTLPAVKAPGDALLLVGDIDYGAAPGQALAVADSRSAARSGAGGLPKWSGLPGTRGEVLAVRDSFEKRHRGGRVTVLREDE